jgi:hypothetical protein
MRAIRLFLLLLPALACVTASAQGCWQFNNGVSSYQTITTDGTNVIAEEYVDGSASMSSTPPCPPVPNNATHTAYATATLTSNSGRQNTANGSDSVCQNCYMISTATAVLPIGTDTSWTASGEGQAVCNMGGVFYSTPFSFQVNFAHSYGVRQSQTPNPPCGCVVTETTYKLQCNNSNGNSAARCPTGAPANNTWTAIWPAGTDGPVHVVTTFLAFKLKSTSVTQCLQLFTTPVTGVNGGPCN